MVWSHDGFKTMKLRERIERMIEGLPVEASITLPVSTLREWLGASEPDLEADLTVQDVAELLGRSPTTVRGWIRSGELRAYKFNNREYRVPRASLQELMDKARASRPPG